MGKNRIKFIYWFLTDREWRESYLNGRRRRLSHNKARQEVMNIIAAGPAAVILSGPFSGMKYIKSFNKEWFTQKVIGFYEYPLREAIESICKTDYRLIVDIGAAEGYYACGLAYRKPDCRVVCFEADLAKHDAIRKIASINNCLNRIRIRGYCDRKSLSSELSSASGLKLVFLDCEGAENDILDSESVRELDRCDILVETHDFIVPGVTDSLIERFSKSHEISVFDDCELPDSVRNLGREFGVDEKMMSMAADELRSPGNRWLWMRARQHD
jgi:hypothetical protein